MDSNEQFFALGKVLKPKGIRGEVKVYPYTDSHCMDYYCTLPFVWIGKELNKIDKYEVVKARVFKNFFLFYFDKITTVEQANTLRQNVIFIPDKLRAIVRDNEILIDDLLESEVFNTKGDKLGKVVKFFDNGANGVCEVVNLENPKSTFLFPVTDEVLLKVQRKQKRLIINPLEQML